jgi:glycogen debranching enzyme
MSAAVSPLQPEEHHQRVAGLGVLERDAPHGPVGCIAQAWGVAETLRVLRLLNEDLAR